jgi:hypothetical protein
MNDRSDDDLRQGIRAGVPAPLADEDPLLLEASKALREEVRRVSGRPDAFWTAQRAEIVARVRDAPARPAWKTGLAWACAVLAVLVGASLLTEKPRAMNGPDFAAGYDQDLLIEVEEALERELPVALEPALVLTGEMEVNLR